LILRNEVGYENAIFKEIRDLSEDEAQSKIRNIREIFMDNLKKIYNDIL
jgi:hypothetical protein